MPSPYQNLVFSCFSVVLLLCTTNASADLDGSEIFVSNARFESENHKAASVRQIEKFKLAISTGIGNYFHDILSPDEVNGANIVAKPLSEIDISNIQSWDNISQVNDIFTSGRDSRFLILDFEKALDKRRILWMFPEEGCFVRAEVLKNHIEKLGFPEVKKLFVFGDLGIESPNIVKGNVTWWYHVAVAVKVDDKMMVIDPSISDDKPLTVAEWSNKLSSTPEDLTYSMCDADTFGPLHSCTNPPRFTAYITDFLQAIFLRLESSNLVTLQRDPLQELADNPPWKTAPKPGTLPFLHPLKAPDDANPTGNIGDVYASFNGDNETVEYYQLVALDVNNEYAPLPTNQEDNASWKYLGDNYPVDFNRLKGVGKIFKRVHLFSNQIDYFRQVKLGPFSFPARFPQNEQDSEHWEYLQTTRN